GSMGMTTRNFEENRSTTPSQLLRAPNNPCNNNNTGPLPSSTNLKRSDSLTTRPIFLRSYPGKKTKYTKYYPKATQSHLEHTLESRHELADPACHQRGKAFNNSIQGRWRNSNGYINR